MKPVPKQTARCRNKKKKPDERITDVHKTKTPGSSPDPAQQDRRIRNQPRKRFDDLAELVASIQDHGIETPLKLTPRGERFTLIGGARRKRAAELARLTEVPAILEEIDDHELRVRQLEDNKNRTDPHPLEDALAYREALKDGWSVKDLARRLGKPASTIYGALKMCELIPGVAGALLCRGDHGGACGAARQVEWASAARSSAKESRDLYRKLCRRFLRAAHHERARNSQLDPP